MTPTYTIRCKACGEFKKLINAHIVPESFCKQLNREEKAPLIVAPNEHPRRAPIGIYDPELLCEDCERQFSAPDDYGQRLLLRDSDKFETSKYGDESQILRLAEYDHDLLKRFAISVLWRASASSKKFFGEIDLGAHSSCMKKIALGQEDCPADLYPIVVGKLMKDAKASMILAPFRERIDQVNYWRVYVGDWHFWIKVDSGRSTPPIFREFEAKREAPLLVLSRPFANSPEHKAARETALLRRVGLKKRIDA